MYHRITFLFLLLAMFGMSGYAQTTPPATPTPSTAQTAPIVDKAAPSELSKDKISPGSKVYIAAINGYESFLTAAFVKKEVPIIVVNAREKADYQITGVSETVQASWAKMLFLGSEQSNELASIVMSNVKTGVVVWGYNVNKSNSWRGKQSSSESCAKHLKARIEGRK